MPWMQIRRHSLIWMEYLHSFSLLLQPLFRKLLYKLYQWLFIDQSDLHLSRIKLSDIRFKESFLLILLNKFYFKYRWDLYFKRRLFKLAILRWKLKSLSKWQYCKLLNLHKLISLPKMLAKLSNKLLVWSNILLIFITSIDMPSKQQYNILRDKVEAMHRSEHKLLDVFR